MSRAAGMAMAMSARRAEAQETATPAGPVTPAGRLTAGPATPKEKPGQSARGGNSSPGVKAFRGNKAFKQQCYLADHIVEFSKPHESVQFEQFTKVLGDPANVVNILASKKGVDPFFCLTPAQYAQLQPLVELYMLKYDTAYDESINMPTDIIRLKFDDHQNPDITDILSPMYGRGGDAGIKSIEIKTLGTNPWLGGYVSCNIVLKFLALETLVQEPEDPCRHYLGLIWNLSAQATGDGVEIQNPGRYRIALRIGWSIPEGHVVGGNGQALKKALGKCTKTVWLEQEKHELSIGQDGSSELSIDYKGTLMTDLQNPAADIFWMSQDDFASYANSVGKSQAAAHMAKRYAKVLTKAHGGKDDWKKGVTDSWLDSTLGVGWQQAAREGGRSADEFLSKKIDDISDERERQKAFWGFMNKWSQEKEAEAKDQKKTKKWKKLVQHMVDNRVMRFFEVDRDIIDYWNLYENSEVRAVLSEEEFKKFGTQGGMGLSGPEVKKIKKHYKKGPEDKYYLMKPPLPQSLFNEADIGSDPMKKTAEAAASKGSGNQKTTGTSGPGKAATKAHRTSGTKRVYWFYFGDLIDAALSVLENRKQSAAKLSNRFRLMVGPMEYKGYATSGATVQLIRDTYINLADVPIAFELFHEWYINYVISVQKSEYYLKDFLEDAMFTLVAPALGSGCKTAAQDIDPSFVTFTSDKRKSKALRENNIVDIKQLASYSAQADPIPPAKSLNKKDAQNVFHFLYMHTKHTSVPALEGDRMKNINHGVYNLEFGLDRGLVKEVNFKRDDVPLLGEVNITSRDANKQLMRAPYSADVRLVGNPLFVPGQLVYIHPPVVRMGNPRSARSISRMLGVGGYFQVLTVTDSYSDFKYETNLECKWVGFGDGEYKPGVPMDAPKTQPPKVDKAG